MKAGNFKKNYKPKYNDKHYQSQPELVRSDLVGSTQYLSLINNDLLYYGNLNILKTKEFQMTVHKMLCDMRILLHMKYDDFWAEITTSESLRKSLASCLQNFPRRISKQHLKKGTTAPYMNEILKDQIYRQWNLLMHTVLIIYHRIVCESRKQEKEVIYNEWLFDIPKILYFIDIYGAVYPKTVKQILQTLFNEIPYYRDDVVDFVRIVKSDLMDSLARHLEFEFSQQKIRKAQNFFNPMRSFNRNLIKSFYGTYEIYHTLLMCLTFFPRQYFQSLIADSCLQLQLLDNYFYYITNIRGRWEMFEDFKELMENTMQEIRQVIIRYIVKLFDLLYQIVFDHHTKSEDVWANCLKTYVKICEYFANRAQFDHQKQWEQLFYILSQQIIDRKVFPMNQKILAKLNSQEKQILKQCFAYQQKYRKVKDKPDEFDQQQKIELTLLRIPSYQQWCSQAKIGDFGYNSDAFHFGNFDDESNIMEASFAIDLQNSGVQYDSSKLSEIRFGSTLKQPLVDKNLSLEEIQKQRINKQYDDEYQQFPEQSEFFLGMGLQPHFDLYREDPEDKIMLTHHEFDLSYSVDEAISQILPGPADNSISSNELSFSMQTDGTVENKFPQKSFSNNQMNMEPSAYSLKSEQNMSFQNQQTSGKSFSLDQSFIRGSKKREPKKSKKNEQIRQNTNDKKSSYQTQSVENDLSFSIDQNGYSHQDQNSLSFHEQNDKKLQKKQTIVKKINTETKKQSVQKKTIKQEREHQQQQEQDIDTSFHLAYGNIKDQDANLSFISESSKMQNSRQTENKADKKKKKKRR